MSYWRRRRIQNEFSLDRDCLAGLIPEKGIANTLVFAKPALKPKNEFPSAVCSLPRLSQRVVIATRVAVPAASPKNELKFPVVLSSRRRDTKERVLLPGVASPAPLPKKELSMPLPNGSPTLLLSGVQAEKGIAPDRSCCLARCWTNEQHTCFLKY